MPGKRLVFPVLSTRTWLKVVAASAVVLAGVNAPGRSLQPGWHYGLPTIPVLSASPGHPRELRCGVCRNDGMGRASLSEGRASGYVWQVGIWDGAASPRGDRPGDMRAGVRLGYRAVSGWWGGSGVVIW